MASTYQENIQSRFQAFYNDHSKQRLISSLLQMEREKLKLNQVGKQRSYTVEEFMLCPICKAVFVEPMTLSCGHTFCRFCLSEEYSSQICSICEKQESLAENTSPTFLLCNVSAKWFPKEVQLAKIKCTAQSLLRQHDFKSALEHLCSKAVLEGQFKLDPNYYCLKAECNAGLGNQNLALENIELAIGLSPSAVHILRRKAQILAEMGDFEKAVLVNVRLVALEPSNVKMKGELESSLNGLLHVDFTNQKDGTMNQGHPSTETNTANVVNSPARLNDRDISVLFTENIQIDAEQPNRGTKEQSHFTLSNEQIFTDEFDCKLCCSLLYKPVTTPCGHTFCDECLRRSLDFRVDCPCCRRPLTNYLAERRANVTLVIENIIKALFPREYQSRKEAIEKEMKAMKEIEKCSEFETPIFVCTLGFPSVPCPLHIFEPRYKLMIRRCIQSGSRQFGMCAPSTDPNQPFAATGTMLKISDVAYLPDGRSLINTEGFKRFQVISCAVKDGYNVAKVKWLIDENVESEGEKSEIQKIHVNGFKLLKFWYDKLSEEQKGCIVNAIGEMPKLESIEILSNDQPKWLWWALAALPLMDKPKLIILSMTSVLERLRSIMRFIMLMIKMQERNETSGE